MVQRRSSIPPNSAMYGGSVQVQNRTTSARTKDTTRAAALVVLDSASTEEQVPTEQLRSIEQIPVGGSSVTVSEHDQLQVQRPLGVATREMYS